MAVFLYYLVEIPWAIRKAFVPVWVQRLINPSWHRATRSRREPPTPLRLGGQWPRPLGGVVARVLARPGQQPAAQLRRSRADTDTGYWHKR